ncbi:MAG TPA: hypothetical protein VF074_22070, partial [Pyrinomonadaceae bacterium]
VALLVGCVSVMAQQNTSVSNEKRVPLGEAAVALDVTETAALEATLTTRTLNGAPDTPVTNIRMVVRNASQVSFAFVSGIVTFYDGAGVRCGEGIFKADALAVNESFETDTPGIRIRCNPGSWRIVATNLLPRVVPSSLPTPPLPKSTSRLTISIDGEVHPIQLDRPMTLTLGDRQRTIIVRETP